MAAPSTLGDLRRAIEAGRVPRRSVKDEVRANLIRKLRAGGSLFPGIVGFDESVIPQVANAILSRHNFILLGLRGQAKSRLLRTLAGFLDEELPVVPGCEIHDDPLAPICGACRARVREERDALPVEWLPREARYVEKLATPDVTIADMLGDIDPIKAARAGLRLGDELTMHYGLLPRANRGIFAINELPDLAGKIQVGLFNILQEGDVQIKGYPIRLPLDLLMVFTANPEDYTARGKIITPLKDRIGSEIRTHYPATRQHAMTITAQEAWLDRAAQAPRPGSGPAPGGRRPAEPLPGEIPDYVREIVEEIAFQARADQKIDKRSGVSQRLPITCLENAVSNAERRAILAGEPAAVPRVTDIYAALPSLTGKFELEYEGELRGADTVARELIRSAVANIFTDRLGSRSAGAPGQTDPTRSIVDWFDMGGTLQADDTLPARGLIERASAVQGLRELAAALGEGSAGPGSASSKGSALSEPMLASAIDFVLEGLYAQKKIGRTDEWHYQAGETPRRQPRPVDSMLERETPPGTKKRYYN
jgi:magnesium chelatase subunit I